MKLLRNMAPLMVLTMMAMNVPVSIAATPQPQSGSFSQFIEPNTGMTVDYPTGGNADLHPKDALAVISGMLPSSQSFYLLSLAKPKEFATLDPTAAMRMLTKEYIEHLPNVHSIREESRWIGYRSQYPAVIKTFACDSDGKKVLQRFVLFNDAKKDIYTVTLVVPESSPEALESLSKRVLSSVNLRSTYGSAGSAAAKPTPAKGKPRTFTHDNLSLTYPAEWTVEPNTDKDMHVKLKTPVGEAWLSSVSNADLNMSVEQLQKVLDEDILTKLPGYSKVNDASRSYAGGISGVKETFRAQHETFPVLGQAFMFQHQNRLYCLMFTTASQDHAKAVQAFDDLATNIRLH